MLPTNDPLRIIDAAAFRATASLASSAWTVSFPALFGVATEAPLSLDVATEMVDGYDVVHRHPLASERSPPGIDHFLAQEFGPLAVERFGATAVAR